MATTVIEEFENLNANLNRDTLRQFCVNRALKAFLQYAFLPEFKFKLQDGVPPYQSVKVEHPEQNSAPMWGTHRLFSSFIDEKLRPSSREKLFLRMLDGLTEEDSIFILGVKDQTLDHMFENISYDKLVQCGLRELI